ncbi:MAG: GerMN domain-containing protein [Chloroflexaceae bacterium]|nr:GerMN domain-containing protein [Chloroflexaceae bacterium]
MPLYFVYDDYRVRITRFIPHTLDIATRTVEELFAGPGSYADRLQTVIPPQTRLRSIRSDGDLVIVDINEAFVNATDRQAALGTLVLSLTDLQNERQQPFFRRVEVRIEGKALADFWGEDYDRQFTRPMLNQEYTTP